LQAVDQYSQYGEVLYISGEESPSQVKHRGDRLGLSGDNISIMSETEMESIYDYVIRKKPRVVVVDSIQTLYSSNFDSIPGTTTQIRECTLKIVELAKTHDISFFLVGHITKDGKVAGPKLLEHMVDSVLQFEGQEGLNYRILRSLKNRFGSTNELGIFNMEEKGMVEVKNPSEFFLSERDEKNLGSIVVPVLEGTKIFLLEVQTLVNESPFGIPKRVVQGFDRNRIQILNAVMEKKIGLNLSSKDVFVNIPGGIKIYDGAADLGVVMAMISITKGIEISQKIAAIGELGLRGEIRKVSFVDKRLKELEKLGFSGVYLPYSNKKEIENNKYNLKMIYLKNLAELAERMK
ncbi:MAG TPA: DNA repair protein RadA, partial [Fusobacteriaceae bacterium]|nr:DNA repair protein RadA [Fusobacteriaceae bacterium]